MRNYTLADAESLFNRLERKKVEYLNQRLQSHAFTMKHFPYQEMAARREVLWLARAQDSLIERFAS